MTDQKSSETDEEHHRRSHGCCDLSLKDRLNFLSSLILPLMLGVFTIVITFQQQKLAREQRAEDMQVVRQQRLEDRNELRLQRELEWNISQVAQAAQSKAIIEQYRDELLITYIKEMGDMLESKNGQITSNFVSRTLARVKTLNALRQLDGARQMHIIGFLYEAGLLTNTNETIALDISTAKLIDINFRTFTPSDKIEKMSLTGVYLENCTLQDKQLEKIDFSFARLLNVDFISLRIYNVNFSFASLNNVRFIGSIFMNVNFSFAKLDTIDFSAASLQNINFTSTQWTNIINFTSADLSIGKITFHRSKMKNIIFRYCHCDRVDFSHANLKGSSFYNAKLIQTNFSLTNLQEVDLSMTNVNDYQLESALSIQNAKLPNGTLGYGQNIVRNGNANCNIPLSRYWQIKNGSIAIMPSKMNVNQCQFFLQSIITGAMMSQVISVTDLYDVSFWTQSIVELQAQMSNGVSLELIQKGNNDQILNKRILNNSTLNRTVSYLLDETKTLEILVIFDAEMNSKNNGNRWCDDIEMFIQYNTA